MSILGRLSVLLSLDATEFTSGMSDAQRQTLVSMQKIEQGIEAARAGFAAYAAAAGAAAAVLTQLNEQASQYQDIAEKMGDTAEQVAALKTASDVAGFSLDNIAGLINKLSASLAKSDDESKGAREALKALGIDLKQFEQLKAVERVEALANAFAQFEDGPQKTALAIAALGRSGAEALPFFNDYVEIGRSQYQLTKDQIAASTQYTETLARLRSEMNQLGQAASGDVAPSMTKILQLLDASIKYYRDGAAATGALNAAMNGLRRVFETIVVIGSEVIFVFGAVGRELGGIAAQLAALARGDIQGFNAISEAMKADAVRARAELDKFQRGIIAAGVAQPEFYGGEARFGRGPVKQPAPSLASSSRGGAAKADNSAQKQAEELSRLIDQLTAKQGGFDGSFFKNLDTLNDAYDRGALSIGELNRLQSILISQQPYIVEGKRAEIEAAKQRNAEFDAEFERIEREQALVEGRIRRARETFEAIQFETSLIGMNSAERAKAIALRQLEASGVKKGTEAYEAFAAKIAGALDVQERAQKAQKDFEDLSNSITQLLRGNGDALKSFVDQAINEFLRLQIVEPLLKSIFGTGGAGGIGGGIGSAIGSLFGGLFGGFRAEGGPVQAGKAYVVGERGPELFAPGMSGAVLPNNAVASMQSAGGGSTTINIYNTIGDVATQAMVVQGMQVVRAQIAGDMSRRERFGRA